MSEELRLVINEREVKAKEGMTILEAAREIMGIEIPTLCYDQQVPPIGSCRVCVVEVEGEKTLPAACHTPVRPRMVVWTHSPKVLKARRVIVELLLSNHPDNCMVCDRANLCNLRKLAADLGVGAPRFRGEKKFYPLDDLGPYVVRDLTKCILCRKCVEICGRVVGERVFAIGYKGFDTRVVVDLDEPLRKEVCKSCDACIKACPTGALERVEERFKSKRGKTPLIITG